MPDKSVLIVEDEFIIALDLQMILEESGWRVIGPAPSVATALRLIDSEKPSVALLDVNLGGELVTPVAEYLSVNNIPFALATAYGKIDSIGSAALSSAPNVGKPIIERHLIATLGALLAGRSQD